MFHLAKHAKHVNNPKLGVQHLEQLLDSEKFLSQRFEILSQGQTGGLP